MPGNDKKQIEQNQKHTESKVDDFDLDLDFDYEKDLKEIDAKTSKLREECARAVKESNDFFAEARKNGLFKTGLSPKGSASTTDATSAPAPEDKKPERPR